MPSSRAMGRLHTNTVCLVLVNELHSQFTPLEGFGYNGGGGTLMRRDPSKTSRRTARTTSGTRDAVRGHPRVVQRARQM